MRDINKEILRLSVPAIVSNVTVPLLSLCDTAISGHLGSELYLAAIAVGSVMLNVVFWLFGFLRAGTTGLTATAFGKGDDLSIRKVFSRSLGIAFTAGVCIILLQLPIMELLLRVIQAEEEVMDYVRRYFRICIFGAPALLGVMSISGWFVGMQTTAYPMAISISVNVINIAFSFLFVFGLGLGFEGVAWGTLCANWIGLAIAYACAVRFRRGKPLWCGVRDIVRGGVGKFFSVNVHLFFRSACIICVSLGVTSAGARLGALTLAVNVIIMQLFQFFSFFMDGFAFSAEALVGRYFGSHDMTTLRSTVKALLGWTLLMSLLFSAVYAGGCGLISGLLTDSGRVLEGVVDLRVWIGLIPLLSSWAFIYDGFYVGITSTKKMMYATFFSTIVFYIIAFVDYGVDGFCIGVRGNGYHWSAFLSYLMLRGAILAAEWKRTVEITRK